MHASAVIIENKGILICGGPGTGKSFLALALIDNCYRNGWFAGLVSDDQTELANANGRLLARSPASIAGKLEIRGCGIIRQPYVKSAIIHLVVDLTNSDQIERMPLPTLVTIEDVPVRQLMIPARQTRQAIQMIFAVLFSEITSHF
jgi:serine kinase of HPr protein (carbohydrate metabolism regulator)